MPIDVARARAETPGCTQVTHLNNCGSALPPRVVHETVCAHLEQELLRGGYEAADAASERLEAVYASVARLIGAGPDEIALTENATVSWQMAFWAFPWQPGQRILTSPIAYASNYINYLRAAQRHGVHIEVVPDRAGALDLEALAGRLDGASLLALTHVPTNGGRVDPVGEAGALARAVGVPFLLDACQSVGQLAVDVEELSCDILTATGRKFLRGPRGTGFLYVRKSLLERLDPPMLDLHSATWTARDTYTLRPDARRFETWEASLAARLGLGAAAEYALSQGLGAIEERVCGLAEALRARLRSLPGAEVLDTGRRRCGIVSFQLAGHAAPEVKTRLRAQGIHTSTSSRFATRIDMEERGLEQVLRAGVHYYNTEEELDRLVAALRAL